MTVWEAAAVEEKQGHPFCLVVLQQASGSTPRKEGASMLVRGDGTTVGTVGGGTLERLAVEDALAAIQDGRTRAREFDLDNPQGEAGAICGGRVTLLFHPQGARRTLHLFGAGHVARATAKLAAQVGYSVIVYDDSEEYATPATFPSAAGFQHGDMAEAAAGLTFGPSDAVVIMTRGHTFDYAILRTFKDRLPPYIGCIASKKKAITQRKQLKEEGWSEAGLDRIHSPIGLDIGSETPEEIAVAILAEIIQERERA